MKVSRFKGEANDCVLLLGRKMSLNLKNVHSLKLDSFEEPNLENVNPFLLNISKVYSDNHIRLKINLQRLLKYKFFRPHPLNWGPTIIRQGLSARKVHNGKFSF